MSLSLVIYLVVLTSISKMLKSSTEELSSIVDWSLLQRAGYSTASFEGFAVQIVPDPHRPVHINRLRVQQIIRQMKSIRPWSERDDDFILRS